MGFEFIIMLVLLYVGICLMNLCIIVTVCSYITRKIIAEKLIRENKELKSENKRLKARAKKYIKTGK